MNWDWLTNAPEVAAKLKRADRAYEAAKAQASNMCLADKLRVMKAARVAKFKPMIEVTP